MADAASTPKANIEAQPERGATVTWGTTTISGLATGAKANLGAYAGRWTLQVDGTYGGATWTLQGSNDGTTWATLHDTAPTQVALTYNVGNKLLDVLERPKYVRMITSGGTGTALVAILYATQY